MGGSTPRDPLTPRGGFEGEPHPPQEQPDIQAPIFRLAHIQKLESERQNLALQELYDDQACLREEVRTHFHNEGQRQREENQGSKQRW